MTATRNRTFLPMDVAAVGYLAVVFGIVILWHHRLADWLVYTAAHAGLIAAVLGLVLAARRWSSGWLRWLRHWYPVLLVPAVFRLNGLIVPQVNPSDLDMQLLAWDRSLFGQYPAAYFVSFEAPWVTDLLRLCWMSYFVLPFLVAVPLFFNGGRTNGGRTNGEPMPMNASGPDRGAFLETAFALSLGWYVSYLGYFVTPAIGPGYYPDLVGSPPTVQHGTTDAMLQTLWHLEGDTARDVCPSGHVIIALIVLWAAFRNRLRIRWLLVPLVTGLIVGTIYLRFHYGVDILAGAVIALAVIFVVPPIHRRTVGAQSGGAAHVP